MNNLHSVWLVVVIALVTAATRFLPFFLFGEHRKTPEIITYLGKVLPYAIMGMLVVYCLKGIRLTQAPFGAPELIGCAIVIGLHVWKRNTLVSIGVGTVAYMLMVQFLF